MSAQRKPVREAVKVLIAEDSPTQAEQLSHLLEENGYKVTAAGNGKEALAAAQKNRPDLVISDIVMPEMDGFALCKEIKSRESSKEIPVILLTALSSAQDVVKGLECGADNFIRKPYDEKYLLSRVEYLLVNLEVRKSQKMQMGVELYLGGERRVITAERQQMVDLLISIYEEAVQMNSELKERQADLARSYQSLNGLYHIAVGLNGANSESEVGREVLERAAEFPAVQAGWLLLKSGEGDFRVVAVHNLPPALRRRGALDGDCRCRRELLSGQLDHAANIFECERLQQANGESGGLRYHASIPLSAGGRVLGILNLAGRDEGMFSDEDLKILHGVGNQVGVALERVQLVESLEKKVEERTATLRDEIAQRKRAQEEAQRNLDRIRALHEIDLAITSTLDLPTVLNVLLKQVELFLPHFAATIRLFNKKSQQLEIAASRNISEEEWKEHISDPKHSPSHSWTVFHSRKPLAVRNVGTDPDIQHSGFLLKQGLISFLGVPLIAKDEALGVLTLYAKEEREFTGEEIEFLTTIAGQAAIAINNSQLYEEIRASRSELESTNRRLEKSLREVSSFYSALAPLAPAESLNQLMEGIIARLMIATGADAALIRLWDDAKSALTLAGQRGFPDYYLKAVEAVGLGGAAEWVFKGGEPIISSNIAAEPRLKGKVQLQVGLRSCAMLPLKVENRVRGILHLASRDLGYFNEAQKDHLMTIARQMSIMLENRELFDNLKSSRDDLEKANKIKDEFLSVMSHELRTPLNVVVGYAGMIKDGLLGEVNPQQQEGLEKVINRANDQLAMVNNILYATVLDTEKITVESHPLVLGDFLRQLGSAYEAPLNKQVKLSWECPSPLAVVHIDSAKLKQILQNLIDNALKFTSQGSITISARVPSEAESGKRRIGETEKAEDRFVVFQVSDTGVGIPKEHLPYVFDKFRQVDSSETRLFGGVGMGLYIVKKFTELLGGTVEVKSEVGQGSTFTVRIPLQG